MDRYERIAGKQRHFWAVTVENNTLTVNWGRAGNRGRTLVKGFASGKAAELEADKLAAQKVKEGYTLVKPEDRALAPNGLARTGAQRTTSPPQAQPEQGIESAPRAVRADANEPMGARSPGSEGSQGSEERRAAQSESTSEVEPQGLTRDEEVDLSATIARALPTRSRPQGRIDGPQEWDAIKSVLTRAIERAREQAHKSDMGLYQREELKRILQWFDGNTVDSAPDGRDPERYFTLLEHTLALMDDSELLSGLKLFMLWLVTHARAEQLVQAACLPMWELAQERGYKGARALPIVKLALRAALVKTSSEYYETVLSLCLKRVEEGRSQDFELMAQMAFLLADDRRSAHALQPLAVLKTLAERGALKQVERSRLIPLILDAPPMGVEGVRAQFAFSDYDFLRFPQSIWVAAATALAAAMHYGESPVPAIKWVVGANAAEIAPLILALEDKDAFSLLLPYLKDRRALASLDQAVEKRPASLLRKMLGAVLAGSSDTRLLTRIRELLRSHPYEELEKWVQGDAKALEWIKREYAPESASMALPADLPPILRDPPWLQRRCAPSFPALALEPIPTPYAYAPRRQQPGGSEGLEEMFCPPLDEVIRAILQYADLTKSLGFLDVIAGVEPRGVYQFYCSLGFAVDDLKTNHPDQFQSLFAGPDREGGAVTFMLMRDIHHIWNPPVICRRLLGEALERFGQRAMPAFMRLFAMDPDYVFELIEGLDYAAIAPHAARVLFLRKRARQPAMAWLARWRRTAILRLVVDAVGVKGQVKDAAAYALSWIGNATEGGRQEIEKLAACYAAAEPRVQEALGQVLAPEPDKFHPKKIPALPKWFNPSALRRPQLKSGGALSDEALSLLVQMFAFSIPEFPYAGIALVRQAATEKSMAAFSWDLFASWLTHGAPAKDIWAMHALAWLGDDDSALKLARLIDKWPGQGAHARAATGLEVLADMGSQTALTLLGSFTEKANLESLQQTAREKMAAIAEKRSLSPQELADTLAPDLDLDESGGLDLDFGARRFRVGFDQFLKPWVKDSSGARIKDLPKANKSDDAQLALEAADRWKALKRNARAAASIHIARLENMMLMQRRVAPQTFWPHFAAHRLVRHLAQRLLWGVYADDDPNSSPTACFRLTEALTLADPQDEPLELDFGPGAPGRIGLVHPMNPPAGGLQAWGALFGDYEIDQPFAQLGRECFALTEEEKSSRTIQRFAGVQVQAASIRSMLAYGWKLGQPQDGGEILYVEKPIKVGGALTRAVLAFSAGALVVGQQGQGMLTIGDITLHNPAWNNNSGAFTFGQLDAVTASELLRAPALILSRAGN